MKRARSREQRVLCAHCVRAVSVLTAESHFRYFFDEQGEQWIETDNLAPRKPNVAWGNGICAVPFFGEDVMASAVLQVMGEEVRERKEEPPSTEAMQVDEVEQCVEVELFLVCLLVFLAFFLFFSSFLFFLYFNEG